MVCTVVYRDSAGWRNCGGSDCGDAGGSVGDSKKNEEGIEGDDFKRLGLMRSRFTERTERIRKDKRTKNNGKIIFPLRRDGQFEIC